MKVKFLVVECPKVLVRNIEGEYVIAFSLDGNGVVYAGMLDVSTGEYLFEQVLTDINGTPTKVPYKALVQVLMLMYSTEREILPKAYISFRNICMARFMSQLPCFKN